MFPDAPTERGVKHLNELAMCVTEGYEAFVVFVVQMQDVDYFTPNYKTHPEFGETLNTVIKAGVKAVAYDCVITQNSMEINGSIPIEL
jgi:sugar fermentation stimulation protein A